MHVFADYGGNFLKNAPSDCAARHESSVRHDRPAPAGPLLSSQSSEAVQAFPFSFRSWNVAGADAGDVQAVVSGLQDTHLLAIQEWPRATPGWLSLETGSLRGLVFQSSTMYRGVAVFFDQRVFTATGRKSSERGIWIKLLHHASGLHVWCGSLHLPHNSSVADYETLLKEFLQVLPKNADRVALAGDFNTKFCWTSTGDGALPCRSDSKWHFLRDAAGQRGLLQVPPVSPHVNAPTYVPRKGNASSSQIDGIFMAGLAHGGLCVDKGSRASLNSDHEQVLCHCVLKCKNVSAAPVRKAAPGGPRRMTRPLPAVREVDQQTLEDLARTCTSNRGGSQRFKASDAVRLLGAVARRSRLPEDWKRYLRELRNERVTWQQGRLEGAASDWKVYREVVKPRHDWSTEYLLRTLAADPTEDIRLHFKQAHVGEGDPGLDDFVRELAHGIHGVGAAEPISEPEVYIAVKDGKRNSAVGQDLVSSELLGALVDLPEGLTGLTSFFQEILATGQMPECWHTSVVKLLPKVRLPDSPKHLRPISLSSHTAKCFTRLLLRRVGHLLLPAGPQQLAAKHRQAVDFVFCTRRILQLHKEWGNSAVLLKTDLRKAFDVVDRRVLAQRLLEWIAPDFPDEAALLVKLLQTNTMCFVLPWQSFELRCCRGVRQGSTESPGLFSKLLDCILCETAAKVRTRLYDDLTDEAVGFMDDIIAWQRTVPQMQAYANTLIGELAAAGLHLQPAKCQLLCLGDTRGRAIRLGDHLLEALPEGESMTVMNLPLSAQASDADLLASLLDRAHQKFHSLREVLCSGAPLRARLKLLDKAVLGTFRWLIGCIFPSTKAQDLLNGAQTSFIAEMMRLQWNGAGLFHEWEIRRRRVARAMLHNLNGSRWGDVHIDQYWAYTGHRVRDGWSAVPSVAGHLSHHRSLTWWTTQQALGGQAGLRHGRRHFPLLMNQERAIQAVCKDFILQGEDWRVAAVDRVKWKQIGRAFKSIYATPWASGRQPSLEM